MKDNNNNNNKIYFKLKKEDNTEKLSFEQINNLYNIERFISFQCYKTSNAKYENNKYIPSFSFW